MRLKRLERWWRRAWIRVLVRCMRVPRDDPPDWDARPRRVLFLRHDRAGDMILSTGVMRAIAESHHSVTLDVLASPINASLLVGADYVADTIIFDRKRILGYLPLVRRLRRARYDAVVDCMVTAPSLTTLLLILASGARYRIGIAGRGNDAAFNLTVPDHSPPGTHMVDRLAALARAFGVEPGAEPSERGPRLHLSQAERDWARNTWGPSDAEHVLVNISAGTADRRWPAERYAAVIRDILQRSPLASVLVIASPADADLGVHVAQAGGGAFAPTPALRHAIALVATADFVFTPDTSIAHAASAFQRPAVAMYRRGTKAAWALYGTTGESIEATDAFASIELEQALAAVDRVWTAALGQKRGMSTTSEPGRS